LETKTRREKISNARMNCSKKSFGAENEENILKKTVMTTLFYGFYDN